MGLWGGSEPTVKKMTRGELLALTEEQQILNDARAGMDAETIAKRKILRANIKADTSGTLKSIGGNQARFELGRSVGEAALSGMRQQATFSREQQMLGEMFGQGEHIWGVNNQPVTINNDLNSSRSDSRDETSSMFGVGSFGEKSGLF